MKRKTGALLGIALLAPFATFGQIGIGPTITFDPTVAAHIISQTVEVVKIVGMTTQTYQQLHNDAAFIRGKGFWAGFPFAIVNSAMMGQSQPTDAWAKAVTHGLNVTTAYANTSIALRSNPAMILQSPYAAHYASAQIGQSATTAAMQTLGNVRTQQQQMQAPISNCSTSALSADPGWNTHAAQENISTACQALLLQQSQAALGVQASALEIETARVKMQTDDYIEYANMVGAAQMMQATQPLAPGNMGASMQAYEPK